MHSASRLVGLILLLAAAAMQVLQQNNPDLSWRNGWWDTLHRAMPRDRGDPADAPAVAVAIDEETMAMTQRWPWPRDMLAALVDQLRRHGAKVVAFDILLDDNDPQSPPALAERFRQQGAEGLASELSGRDDTDLALARTIYDAGQRHGMPTILPVPGVPEFPGVDPETECAFEKPIVRLEPPELVTDLGKGAASADPPLPIYQEAGAALSAIEFNASQDFVIRSVRALQPICGSLFPLLGAQALS
ncbi:MAG: CHASE2 domain-containing protein, partial [Pseudomonadota bacterium]